MSCFMMPADCLATISKTLESILNCGFNGFGFSAPSSLHDALKDCRDRYGYYSDCAIFRRLYSLNLAAYNGRYSKGPTPETIPDMPEVPALPTMRQYADHHEKLLPWHFKFCKLLDCLIYQADEDATYKAPLFLALVDFSHRYKTFLVCNMEEYQALPWGSLE